MTYQDLSTQAHLQLEMEISDISGFVKTGPFAAGDGNQSIRLTLKMAHTTYRRREYE